MSARRAAGTRKRALSSIVSVGARRTGRWRDAGDSKRKPAAILVGVAGALGGLVLARRRLAGTAGASDAAADTTVDRPSDPGGAAGALPVGDVVPPPSSVRVNWW